MSLKKCIFPKQILQKYHKMMADMMQTDGAIMQIFYLFI